MDTDVFEGKDISLSDGSCSLRWSAGDPDVSLHVSMLVNVFLSFCFTLKICFLMCLILVILPVLVSP